MHITQKRLTMLAAMLALAWSIIQAMPAARAADVRQEASGNATFPGNPAWPD